MSSRFLTHAFFKHIFINKKMNFRVAGRAGEMQKLFLLIVLRRKKNAILYFTRPRRAGKIQKLFFVHVFLIRKCEKHLKKKTFFY